MAKIFARSILLLSVVTTALSLFQHGIVSRDQQEIADSFTNIPQNINGIKDALNTVDSHSGFSDLMTVHNTLVSTKQSFLVAIHYIRGASSFSATVEQAARVSLDAAKEAVATVLSDFSSKANQLEEIYFGSVTEGCNYLKDFYVQFTTLASSCERFDSEYRKELEAARDAILSMLLDTIHSSTCAGK
ncbi:hypothetical protein MVEN_01989100 [Mycena venus]|uniref:Pectinesterase inhibitor domain-containing protein n=1 Tax=Mycena venus TaxID=2733690 RepID=A0A8H6XES9_9AGAR|nr:hypothetical protein MVEN_01989100 [Mycena venus]